MAKVNNDNLEKALGKSSVPSTKKPVKSEAPKMPKEVEIGFHQGAITTLVNERNELMRMANNVEAIVQAHVKRLEELGVKVTNQRRQ